MKSATSTPCCLRCRHFRLLDLEGGLCRVEKGEGKNYPRSAIGAHCDRWQDCGQQYFVRLGWLKARSEANDGR